MHKQRLHTTNYTLGTTIAGQTTQTQYIASKIWTNAGTHDDEDVSVETRTGD